jgi:Sec7-like guanine-nucleotide exchange factor
MARSGRMAMSDFQNLTKDIKNGDQPLQESFLREIYDEIEKNPITLVEDDEARFKLDVSKANTMRKKTELFINELENIKKKGQE